MGANNLDKIHVGRRFGRLEVVAFSHRSKRGLLWWTCRCECGNTITTAGAYLRNGDTASCGCINESRVLEDLRYDAASGHITEGANVLGTVNALGYLVLRVDGRLQTAHRVAWRLASGAAPTGVIDHRNGIKTDNRLVNLRDVTQAVNTQNTVHAIGAHLHKTSGRWKSAISVSGRQYHLGFFDSAADAAECYAFAKSFFHDAPRRTYG